jgi:hypothetical protein
MKKTIKKAVDVFRKTTGLEVEYQTEFVDEIGTADGLIRITHQELELYFAVEAKQRVNRATIGIIAQKLMTYTDKGILITRYVTPQLTELLKEMDIPFMDTAGNAYINAPPLLIYIKGNKPTKELHQEPLNRVFKVRGLHVLFALLCNPGLEDQPLREIAKAANVALGTVQWVFKDLKTMGYLVDMGKLGRKLIRREDLLKRWVTVYPEQLRPKQLKGRFKATNGEWWRNIDIDQYEAFWGGEVAANKLTAYLKPEMTTIYTKQPIGKLVLKNRLKKDPDGNVEILNVFWNFEPRTYLGDMVHPILTYADLIATGDTRNIEAAKMIYEKEITQFIRED